MNKNKSNVLVGILVLAAILSPGIVRGAEEKTPTADEIVRRANLVAYYQGEDGKARVKMNIVDAQGRTRQRDLTILRWDAPDPKAGATPKKDQSYAGEQKFFVFFHEPADVAKMTYLVWKHLDREDDRWLYMPALDLVKRIAGTEKRTSFVGSDFYYEDISGRNVDADTHELVETTKEYYVLQNTPKDPKKVEFDSFKTWVHKPTSLVVKVEYYKDGKPYRRYEAKGVKQIQGYWTVIKSRMTDLLTGRYTDLEYSGVKYDLGLPEDVFTERYLRRPPNEYLKD